MDSVPAPDLRQQEPNSFYAEQAVLGCLFGQPENVNEAINRNLRPEDFYYPAHRLIYESVLDLVNQRLPVDTISLTTALDKRSVLDKAGGVRFLTELKGISYQTSNFTAYLSEVKEKAQLRRLIADLREIGNYAQKNEASSDQLIDLVFKRMIEIRDADRRGDFVRLSEALTDRLNELFQKERHPIYKTGFGSLDQMIGGLRKGALYILAARPSMGKSAFAFNIAAKVAKIHRKAVAIFSLEMSKGEVSTRFLASEVGINSKQLGRDDMKASDWEEIAKKSSSILELPIYIDDRSGINPMEMTSRCRELQMQGKDLGLIVVDYLQLMSSSRRRQDDRQQEISDISRQLKIMARELETPVLALSQLSRACEKRQDKRPMLSDLRDSGAIEQDADVVMFLYRDAYYRDKEGSEKEHNTGPQEAELIISKNRHGETSTVKLGWLPAYTRFYEMDERTASLASEMPPPPPEAESDLPLPV